MPLTQTAINRAILNAYSTEELKNYWIIKFGSDVKWPTKPKAIPALLTKIASEGVATGKPESVV
jgi:DNA-binding IclR family transcriptional regulator